MRRTTIGEHPDGKVDLGTFWDGGGCVVVCGLISCSARPVPCIFASCTSKRTTVHSITVVIWRSACLFGDEREVVDGRSTLHVCVVPLDAQLLANLLSVALWRCLVPFVLPLLALLHTSSPVTNPFGAANTSTACQTTVDPTRLLVEL